MAQLDVTDVVKRSDAAWALRDRWKSILQDAYDMVFAGISPYSGDKKGPRPMNRQFESTAVQSTIRLTNRLLTELTPPWERWASVEAGPVLEMQVDEEQIKQLKPTLEQVSNFTNIIVNSGQAVDARRSAFLDVVIAGMGCVLGLEDTQDDIEPIIDQCVSQAEVAIDENAKGRLNGIYRKRMIKVRDITDVWEDAVIPASLTEQSGKDKDPEIEVLEATYSGKAEGGRVIWYYEVIWRGSQKGMRAERLVERTYDVCPWTIWRWMKLPGLPYGPGPVLLALADIRTINKVMEFILQNAALALAGMYLVRDDGVLDPANIVIQAGGMIPVASTGGTIGASMVPLTTNREFEIGQIVLNDLRMTIKKHLFDTSLPPDRATPSSATEILQRVKELNQDIGVGVGRMEADTVQYVRRRIEILQRRGMIPMMPVDQFILKIQINAPLVRAQRLNEIENVINWIQMASQIAPQALPLIVASERIVVWLAEQMGVPNDLLRSDEEKQAMEQQMAQAAMIQQAGMMQQQQAA